MNVTGSHGQELFTVPPNHSRVYLPEALVLHDNDYNVMKETTEHDVIEAKKFGISLEEYRQQNEYVALAAEKKDRMIAMRLGEEKRKEQSFKEEETAFGAGAYNQDNIEAALSTGQSIELKDLVKNEDVVRKQREIMAQLQAQSVRDETEQPPNQEADYEVIEHGLRERDSDDSFIEIYHYSPSLSTQDRRDVSSHHEVSRHVLKQSDSGSNILRGAQQDRYGRCNSQPGSSSSTPQRSRSNCVSASPRISAGIDLGSMVVVRNTYGPPMYGVVKWLGQLPDVNGEYAGVELVSKYDFLVSSSSSCNRYFQTG